MMNGMPQSMLPAGMGMMNPMQNAGGPSGMMNGMSMPPMQQMNMPI